MDHPVVTVQIKCGEGKDQKYVVVCPTYFPSDSAEVPPSAEFKEVVEYCSEKSLTNSAPDCSFVELKILHNFFLFQIKETGQRTKTLLENEVQPAVSQLAECLADWYKMAQTVHQQGEILESEINAYEMKLSEFTNKICENDVMFYDRLTNISRVICTVNSKHGGRVKAQEKKKTRTFLSDMTLTGEEILSVLKQDTNNLVQEVHSMAIGISEENGLSKSK